MAFSSASTGGVFNRGCCGPTAKCSGAGCPGMIRRRICAPRCQSGVGFATNTFIAAVAAIQSDARWIGRSDKILWAVRRPFVEDGSLRLAGTPFSPLEMAGEWDDQQLCFLLSVAISSNQAGAITGSNIGCGISNAARNDSEFFTVVFYGPGNFWLQNRQFCSRRDPAPGIMQA